MVTYENQCCDCATDGYPCIGNSCRRRHFKVLTCDRCKQEVYRLYKFDGQELCEDCVLHDLEVIE
jgi:hypothetical protein